MKQVNVKVYTLTEAELIRFTHIAFNLNQEGPAPDNMKVLVQAAIAKLKKDLEG